VVVPGFEGDVEYDVVAPGFEAVEFAVVVDTVLGLGEVNAVFGFAVVDVVVPGFEAVEFAVVVDAVLGFGEVDVDTLLPLGEIGAYNVDVDVDVGNFICGDLFGAVDVVFGCTVVDFPGVDDDKEFAGFADGVVAALFVELGFAGAVDVVAAGFIVLPLGEIGVFADCVEVALRGVCGALPTAPTCCLQ